MPNKAVQISAEFVGLDASVAQALKNVNARGGINLPIKVDSRSLIDFNSQLDRATQRVITLGTAFSVLSTANRLIRDMVSSTVEVEKSLTSVNAIFKLTTDNINRFSGALFDISRETATSFNEVAKAATEFSRQGLSVIETQKATRAALLLSRDANIDVEESVKALTAATNSFNKEALSRLQVANRLAAVDAAFAVSSKDLAEALIRTGSAAADAGVNFNQFIGLVTAAQQVSQRGGSVIAGALNTIFTRINRKDTLEALDSLGIAITDVRGQALPTIQVLSNFAVAYDKMTGSVKNQTAELVGGVRQLNTLKATLTDLATTGSVFAQVQEVIARNQGELERRNAARNQTLGAQISQVVTSAQQIGSNIGNVGFAGPAKALLGPLVDNPITKYLQEANGSAESDGGKLAESLLKGFGSAIIFGVGPIIAKVLTSITSQVTGNLFRDIGAITGLNSEAQKQAAIETEIVAIYKAGGVALRDQLAAMSSITEQAALMRSIMNSSVAATSSSALAAEVMSQERGFNGYSRQRIIRKYAASGHIPYGQEASAIAAGIGGAPASARPVYLPSFNRGGGQMGIVANTSEFIVPHMAGGGSAIYNQSMIQKYGLPPGSKPVAAGGYIPNAAGGREPDPYYQNFSFRSALSPASLASKSGLSSAELSSAFSLARKEEEKEFEQLIKEEAKKELAASKKLAAAKEEAFKIIEQDNIVSKKKSGYTKTEAALSEKRLTQLQAEESENRELLTRNFVNQKLSAKAASAAVAPPARRVRIGPDGREYAVIPAGTSEPESDVSAAIREAGIRENRRIEDRIIARERAKSATSPSDPYFVGPRLPPGWMPPAPPQPSFLSRTFSKAKGYANSPMGSLSLALGLPFLGGLIDEKKGGTTEGIERGTLSGALKGAGTGATFGGFIGQPLLGAGIGAAIGGLIGGVSKSTKSFEEFSLELDQKTKKLGEELSSASEVFRIQSDLKDALLSDNQEQVVDLKKQRSAAIAKVSNPAYLGIINKYLDNPEQGGVAIARAGNGILGPNIVQSNLAASMAHGQLSIGDIFAKTLGGDPFTKQIRESGVSSVTGAISGYSDSQLQTLRDTAKNDLPAALEEVGKAAGLATDQIEEMTKRLKESGPSQTAARDLANSSVFGAINNLLLRQKVSPRSDQEIVTRERDLIQLAGNYRLQGENLRISGGASAQIASVRQQIALSNPALTDVGRLSLQGTFGAQNINAQAGVQSGAAILADKGNLIDIARTKNLSQVLINQIKGANSLDDFQNLASNISTTGGREAYQSIGLGDQNSPFRKTLTDLIDKLKELGFTTQQNIRVNRESYQAQLQELRLSKTYGGARRDYGGAALNAGQSLISSLNRRDTPDILAQKMVDSNTKNLQDQYNRSQQNTIGIDKNLGRYADLPNDDKYSSSYSKYNFPFGSFSSVYKKPMNTGEFRGGLLGIQANADAVQRIAGDQAVRSILANPNTLGAKDVTGAQVQSGLFSGAQQKGIEGKAQDSFTGGFTSVFAGAKRDAKQFAEVGVQVADSLKNNFSSAFGDFVTGTKKAKDAFRDFVVSVLSESARIFATKAITSLLGNFFGSFGGAGSGTFSGDIAQNAKGGPIGRASGGGIPTMLTSGEYVFPPSSASRIGGRMLGALNSGTMRGFAPGGLVSGGSGVRDDVFQHLAAGSYVIRKPMVERYGAGNLAALSMGGMPDDGGTTSLMMATGGPVASMMNTPAPVTTVAQGSSGGVFNIGVTINDHSTSTQTSSSTQGGDINSRQFAETLSRRMKQVALDTIVEQKRMSGMLRPQSNLFPS